MTHIVTARQTDVMVVDARIAAAPAVSEAA